MATILCSYFPTVPTPTAAGTSPTSATPDSSPSPLADALLAFLLSFRPTCFVQLCRITQLYSTLTTRHLFPYRAFVQHLLTTGAVRATEGQMAGQTTTGLVDLTDWPSLAEYYLTHIPIPLADTAAPPVPSLALPDVLPSTAVTTARAAPEDSDMANLLELKYATLRTSEKVRNTDIGRTHFDHPSTPFACLTPCPAPVSVLQSTLRLLDLVYLDLVWLLEIEVRLSRPEEDTSDLAGSAAAHSVMPSSHVMQAAIDARKEALKKGVR